MKIQSTANVKNHKVKLLDTGPSGAGKTTSIGTLKAAGFRPIVYGLEAGLLPLSRVPGGIDFIDGSKDENGKPLPRELRSGGLRKFFAFLQTEECRNKYDTVVLDSLTEISQCLFDELKAKYPDRKDSLVLYGELGQYTRSLIKNFRDLDYHVVITCLTKVEKDEATGKRYVAFDLIGSISEKVAQLFDIVLYLRVTPEGGREFVCCQTESIGAKDRSGRLDPIEKPDLGEIFKKVLSDGKE